MKRKIVHIDKAKCNGCGLCVGACHEGAIQLVDGKAELVSDIYCDGLGDCLGACPMDAIRIEVREADAFDAAAVAERQRSAAGDAVSAGGCPSGGCPGMRALQLGGATQAKAAGPATAPAGTAAPVTLGHWPVQLHLVPPTAPWWADSDILLCADCVAIAAPAFREQLLAGRSVAIACPKLDDTSPYVEKLAAILSLNPVRSLTVARMSVPCCGGIVRIAEEACSRAAWQQGFEVVTIDIDGKVLGD